jgi:hypothetical protein
MKINIYCGQHIVTTADVELSAQGCIQKVVVDLEKFYPVNANSAEIQRLFVLEDHARLGWDITPEDAIARGISRVLYRVDEEHCSEDHWLDAAYEDKYVEL